MGWVASERQDVLAAMSSCLLERVSSESEDGRMLTSNAQVTFSFGTKNMSIAQNKRAVAYSQCMSGACSTRSRLSLDKSAPDYYSGRHFCLQHPCKKVSALYPDLSQHRPTM